MKPDILKLLPSGRVTTGWTFIGIMLTSEGFTTLTLILAAVVVCVMVATENMAEMARIWRRVPETDAPATGLSDVDLITRLVSDKRLASAVKVVQEFTGQVK